VYDILLKSLNFKLNYACLKQVVSLILGHDVDLKQQISGSKRLWKDDLTISVLLK